MAFTSGGVGQSLHSSALPPPAFVPHYCSSCRAQNTTRDLLGSTLHGVEGQRRREAFRITLAKEKEAFSTSDKRGRWIS